MSALVGGSGMEKFWRGSDVVDELVTLSYVLPFPVCDFIVLAVIE